MIQIRNPSFSIHTRMTQIKGNLFHTEKIISIGFLKVIGVQFHLPISFGISLVYINILKFTLNMSF